MERTVLFYKHYFIDFFNSINEGVQRKMAYVVEVLKTQQRIGTNFVRYIRDGLFELRIQHEGNIIMLFNGFQKKTRKTPENEIEKAIKLKNEYYAEKQ